MKKLLAACTAALRAIRPAEGTASSLAPRHATHRPRVNKSRPRLTKVIAGSTTAVLAIGLAVVGVAAPASAHTPSIVSNSCSVLTVNLTAYAGSVAAVPAKGYTEYEWSKTTTDTKVQTDSPGAGWVQGAIVLWEYQHTHGQTRWEDSANWNSQSNSDSLGWALTGNVKYTWTYSSTETIWATTAPGWAATGNTRFHETTPAVPAKTNHVTVTIDGAVKANADFGTSYSSTFSYATSTSAHSWNVTVTAWDNSQYNLDKSGVSTPCATPVAPSYTAAVCTAPGVSGDGSYTIPTVAGIRYLIRLGGNSNGSGNGYAEKSAGTYPVVIGTTIHIIAEKLTGYTVTGDVGPWNFTATSAGACLSNVTPIQPTFTPEACTGPGLSTSGSYVIPATSGVVYSVSLNGGQYVITAAGTYTAADNDGVSVKAIAAPNYVLTGYQASWNYSFTDSGQCLVMATPVSPTIVSIENCGTLGSVTPATTTGVSYLVTPADVTEGAYSATATANAGYYFAYGATTEWSGDLGVHTECVTPAHPTATAAVCDVQTGETSTGYITIPATTGIGYLIDGLDVSPGDHAATPGQHTVSALAKTGYTLEGESSWTLNVGVAGECLTRVEPAAAMPSAEVCDYASGTITSGYITIPETEHVAFTIDGGSYGAGKHDFANGSHTVIVTAEDGYILVGDSSYTVTIEAAGACLTPLTPSDLAVKPQTCDSATGGLIDGYITVGDTENVNYTIDGNPAVAGKNIVGHGQHTVVATAKDGYRLTKTDSESDSLTWTLNVAAAGSCELATLTTPPALAFTGTNGNPGGMFLLALFLLIGGAGVYTSSRVRSRKH